MPQHPKTIEQTVSTFIKQKFIFDKNDKVLVAFSGGSDSVFLLEYLNNFKEKFAIQVSAAHFNHKLRAEESERDELFVREFCDSRGIELFVDFANVQDYAKNNKISVEEASRNLRYRFLEEIAIGNNFTKICTAHNKNDNTETILLNLAKGTGISGWGGIPIKREKIVRPILILEKSEIENYLNSKKIPFVFDSTNATNDYQRNLIRNEILPILKSQINPNIDEALFRSSEIFRQFSSILDEEVKKLESFFQFSENKLFVNYDSKSEFIFLMNELLKKKIEEFYKVKFEFSDFQKIESLSNSQKGKIAKFKHNLVAIRETTGILFTQHFELKEKNVAIEFGKEFHFENQSIQIIENEIPDFSEIIDINKIEGSLFIRKWKIGDKFKPINFNGTKKISDFLTDLKINASNKRNIWILSDSKKIVYVIGFRISDEVKITENTKQKLYIKWQKN